MRNPVLLAHNDADILTQRDPKRPIQLQFWAPLLTLQVRQLRQIN